MPDGVAITASEFKGLEVSKRQTKISPTESRRAQLDGLPGGLEPGRIFNLEAWTQGTKPNEFLEMKQAIQQQISQATSIARGGPRLSLAQFYFAKGLAAETMGLLRTISDSDEEMARRPDVIALRGASQFILGRFLDAEKELDNRVLNGFSEAELWRGASNAAQGKWAAAIEHFARAGEIPGDYPRNFSIQLSLLAAEAAIRAEDYRGAGVFLDAIAQGKPTIGEQARLNYLRGRVLYASADIATALSFWRRLTNGTDRWASVRAKRALIEHNLRENTITRPQAIERLERLRFAWRGDQLEFDLLRRLGELYIEEEDFTAGLTSLRQAVTFFPNNISARSVSKKMTKSFSGIYTDGTSDAMTPLTALALYDQFRELTPVGRRGDKIIQRLADRLVEVDLLDRASVLLDRQVRFRLQGVQKAQVGSRLALIRLLDRQPNTALEALDESVAPGLDPKLALQRKRLRARSVFELGDSETALKLIKSDNDRDADLLRADIFWRTRDWVNAGKVFERLIGNAGRDGRRINDLSAALILNWVVALSMSEQVDALNKVRQIYSTQMDMTEYRDAFRLITNKTEGDMQDFRTLTERFKEIGRFQAFLTSYREKLKTKLLSEMN
jgi:tetratricopeptide (TPR) repeat protein